MYSGIENVTGIMTFDLTMAMEIFEDTSINEMCEYGSYIINISVHYLYTY